MATLPPFSNYNPAIAISIAMLHSAEVLLSGLVP